MTLRPISFIKLFRDFFLFTVSFFLLFYSITAMAALIKYSINDQTNMKMPWLNIYRTRNAFYTTASNIILNIIYSQTL